MFIVKMHSGLANRMFQYAFYKYLTASGKEVYIDDNSFLPNREHEINVSIENIFHNVNFQRASRKMINLLSDQRLDYYNKFRRKHLKQFKKSHFKENIFSFDASIINLTGDYYLDGFWQTEKYFSGIENTIRHNFTFPEYPSKRNRFLAEMLASENSVAIHVRKGADYMQIKKHTGVCGIDYYTKAIDYINSTVENPVFYVFSDNFDWVNQNLTNIEHVNVDWNPSVGAYNYLDMQLMACCKHNIIANSSYSWWAAWLNKNNHKNVIAPNAWFSDDLNNETIDIVPQSWIKI